MKIVLILIYLILTVAGLIFMKLGGNTGKISVSEGDINFGINWISAIGFICYIMSFLLFTKIVLMFDLSYIYPIITGIVQILSLVFSALVFNENIGWQTILGATIIIIGIIIMNVKTS